MLGEQCVCLTRPLQREAVRDERCSLQPAVGEQVQHGLEVALLGPAHEAERIVVSGFLVLRIVAAGPVRARNLEGELLLVEVGA